MTSTNEPPPADNSRGDPDDPRLEGDGPKDPHRITHSELSPEDQQRGQDPSHTVGPWPTNPPDQHEPDPKFQPDRNLLKLLIGQFDELGKKHRPHREDVLPYLLIRAFTPGDRGARPTWPPTPCWESPDLLLIDATYTGAFDPGRLVGSPVSGRAYRVFVRVFNLGLVPAIGTHLRAWFVEPGFFSGQPGYEPHLIGGAYVDLDDRTRGGAQRVVELDLPWVIPTTLTGHECMVATASCPADPWSGVFDANADRHLGQRNLEIAVGAQDIEPLLAHLGGMLPDGGTLELFHGGPAVVPLLNGVVGGRLTNADGEPVPGRLVAPDPKTLRRGIVVGRGLHLLTALRQQSASMATPTEVLAEYALVGRTGDPAVGPTGDPVRDRAGADPFAERGGPAQYLRQLDPQALRDVALVAGPGDLPDLLLNALRKMLDIGDLRGSSVAAALGGGTGAAHLLRFVATDTKGHLVGGYSIVVR